MIRHRARQIRLGWMVPCEVTRDHTQIEGGHRVTAPPHVDDGSAVAADT